MKEERRKSQEHFDNVLNNTADQILKEKMERRRKLSQEHKEKYKKLNK